MSCLAVVARGELRIAVSLQKKAAFHIALTRELLRRNVNTATYSSNRELSYMRKGKLLRDQLYYVKQWQHIRMLNPMTDELRFEVTTRNHFGDIEELMLSEFGTKEPLTRSLKPTAADLRDFFHDLAEFGCSNGRYSTVVYNQNRLVAICLCSVEKYDGFGIIPPEIDVKHHDFAEEIRKGPYKQHKANQLFAYVSALEQGLQRLLSTSVFKMNILCVLSEYKGRGLGRELTRRAIEVARSADCEWIATAATAAASQAIFRQIGFQVLYEIPYSAFRENGNVVYRNLHDGCKSGKLMALRLN